MARFYPKLGSCPTCGGTGRTYKPKISWNGDPIIGDNTVSCSVCHGSGCTREEERKAWAPIIKGLKERLEKEREKNAE